MKKVSYERLDDAASLIINMLAFFQIQTHSNILFK